MKRTPARLGEKLLAIRRASGLSQNGILKRLGLDDDLTQAEWSAYERGVRIPALTVLRLTSELAGIWMDVLVDDDIDLPEALPANPKSAGVRRKQKSKSALKSVVKKTR